ncbi:MAG: helix-turn-helix domain-containing protein [Gammaproteobacteria bacterium]|nr:helix-turn-helix domain-containing protein [Gammaproteobacteria bacterium]
MKKQHVQLSEVDRAYLEAVISKGKLTAKVYRRALGLLELDRGQTYTAVSKTLQVTIPTLSNWAAKYRETGLQVLQDQPRSGRPVEIDGHQRAKVTALACSEPPEGYARWSLRLLADKAVELEYCEHISHTEVRSILKKTN